MVHVVLLGDSIFDNARYVPGGPSVVEQLRSRLPRGSEATLLARDGAGTVEIAGQLKGLPEGATHLIAFTDRTVDLRREQDCPGHCPAGDVG